MRGVCVWVVAVTMSGEMMQGWAVTPVVTYVLVRFDLCWPLTGVKRQNVKHKNYIV